MKFKIKLFWENYVKGILYSLMWFVIGFGLYVIMAYPLIVNLNEIKANQAIMIHQLDSLNSHYEEIKSVQYDMVDMLGDTPCDSIY